MVEKIAAGEVIERPASVVKEVVENAIDAEATRIDIAVEDAGFSLIRVSDNGHGMDDSDLERCLISHATSKIAAVDDIFSVATMGFRGEALASIAAVSRLTVSSSDTEDGLGNCVTCEGGKITGCRPVSHTRGATLVCRDLFYNVPARKKFMKTRRGERMALLRLVEQLVLSFPGMHFTYAAEGKHILDLPGVNTPRERIAQVYGMDFAQDLVACSGEATGMSVQILVSHPQSVSSSRPRAQSLYVNLRRVDSDQVTFAVRESYSRFLTSNLRPAWFCFLETDPSRIDVNIHPTKQRIKFEDERGLFGFIHRTVQNGIGGNVAVESDLGAPAAGNAQSGSQVCSGGATTGTAPTMPLSTYRTAGSLSAEHAASSVQTALSFLSVAERAQAFEKDVDSRTDRSVELAHESWEPIPCYQIHKMFVLAPIKQGIVLIDQHAAHERIMYERALQDMEHGKNESQRLLFPVLLDLSPTEKSVVLASRDNFVAVGFDLQDFGGRTIAVSAVPAAGLMKVSSIEDAVREIIQSSIDEKNQDILAQPQKHFAASYACGVAIKAGQELKQEEMNSLLHSLFATENPYVCPHGRPTLIRISLDELARRFLR